MISLYRSIHVPRDFANLLEIMPLVSLLLHVVKVNCSLCCWANLPFDKVVLFSYTMLMQEVLSIGCFLSKFYPFHHGSQFSMLSFRTLHSSYLQLCFFHLQAWRHKLVDFIFGLEKKFSYRFFSKCYASSYFCVGTSQLTDQDSLNMSFLLLSIVYLLLFT